MVLSLSLSLSLSAHSEAVPTINAPSLVEEFITKSTFILISNDALTVTRSACLDIYDVLECCWSWTRNIETSIVPLRWFELILYERIVKFIAHNANGYL